MTTHEEGASQTLADLREEIDDIDAELVALLARRMKVTANVGHIKEKEGLPVYVPEREHELLKKRASQAESLGLNAGLIDDVLRRVMRESYKTQNAGYLKVNPDIQKVVVVGGHGALGARFASMMTLSGYSVEVLEQNDWHRADEILKNAGLVIVAVPIDKTEQIIAQLPALPDDCILADITSVKTGPLQAMLAAHKGPVIGLHPMFGPDSNFVKQVVVACEGRFHAKCQWLLDQITLWGCRIQYASAQKHDEAMVLIQGMRHLTSFMYGRHLMQQNSDLSELMAFSSPIYRLELAMVGRLFAQNPALYADIIYSAKGLTSQLSAYRQLIDDAIDMVNNKDHALFVETFGQIKTWFGEFADDCLKESQELLMKAGDRRV